MATSSDAARSPIVAVVLAGGQGTRLRRVLADRPKPLAPVAGRPFVEWVLRYLRGQGVVRAVLSTGYLAGQVRQFAGELRLTGIDVSCVEESEPLGTAGGFLQAWHSAARDASAALVLNGDSLALASLKPLLETQADAAVLGVRVADSARYGTLEVGPDSRLVSFREKTPQGGPAIINAGVYAFARKTIDVFAHMTRPLSFENDVFPALLQQGADIRVAEAAASFLDIGTEESLARAGSFIAENAHWFD
jgi:D-glycero-alpha-D-manno-heptose 1-phosphate guanylyltransferase